MIDTHRPQPPTEPTEGSASQQYPAAETSVARREALMRLARTAVAVPATLALLSLSTTAAAS